MGNKGDYDDLEMTMRLGELTVRIKSTKSDENFKALKAELESLEKDREHLQKRFNESLKNFFRRDVDLGSYRAVIEEPTLNETEDILRGVDDGKTKESDSFEQKMHVMMKDGDSGKKGLMKWIQDCEESDEKRATLIAMKVQAVQVGLQLSNLIVDFVFMISWQEDLAAKIGGFRSAASKWVTENENSLVIGRIVSLLEMSDIEVSKMKKSKEVTNKGWTTTALDKRSRVGELLNELAEQVGNKLLDELIEISVRLESIMIVGASLRTLECDLNKCEGDVEEIRRDIDALKITFPLKLGIMDSKMRQTRDMVASNIYELWNGLVTDSSDEDQREQPLEAEDHPIL